MEKRSRTNVDFQMIIFLYLNARFSDEASFVSSQGMNGVNLRDLLLWAKIIPKYCLYCVSFGNCSDCVSF